MVTHPLYPGEDSGPIPLFRFLTFNTGKIMDMKDPDFPKIICLCGSTRFTEQMLIKQWELTKQGHIVLSWCALPNSYWSGSGSSHIGEREGVKEIVDEVHKRKIDLSDEIYVINIGGYIGESTRNEIDYAFKEGKMVLYEEPLT